MTLPLVVVDLIVDVREPVRVAVFLIDVREPLRVAVFTGIGRLSITEGRPLSSDRTEETRVDNGTKNGGDVLVVDSGEFVLRLLEDSSLSEVRVLGGKCSCGAGKWSSTDDAALDKSDGIGDGKGIENAGCCVGLVKW